MFKKIFSIITALSLVTCIATGCGQSNVSSDKNGGDTSGNKEVVSDKKDDGITLNTIHVGTGGSTGTYYAYTQAVAIPISNKTGYTFDVATTGGSKDNIESLVAGTYDMAIVQNDVMSYAYNGEDMFGGKTIKDFSVIGSVYTETVQIVAKKDAGITTVADLKGKRVSVGDAGSGVEFNAGQILSEAGIDMESDITKQNLGFSDSASALKDGNIDAFFCVAGAPTTAITELSASTDIQVLGIDDSMIDNLKEKYSFYAVDTLTHDDYSFIEEGKDVKTVGVKATYIISNDISDEQVYNITKAIWESKSDITHAKASEMDINEAATALGGVPLHPGAYKYYKEKGLVD